MRFACTGPAYLPGTSSPQRIEVGRRLALAHSAFLGEARSSLFLLIRVTSSRPVEAWEDFFSSNSHLARSVRSVVLDGILMSDVKGVCRLVASLDVGLAFDQLTFRTVSFDEHMVLTLRHVITRSPNIAFISCSYRDIDIIIIMAYHPSMSVLSLGASGPCKYKGNSTRISISDSSTCRMDVEVTKPFLPLRSLVYHLEYDPLYLFGSTVYQSHLLPRVKGLEVMYARIGPSALALVQRLLEIAWPTLRIANPVINTCMCSCVLMFPPTNESTI